MKIRHIPFGYTIINGEYVLNKNEAKAVIDIFEMYVSGKSYGEIAKTMTIPYREEVYKWDKNMVKRILENKAYTGESIYPQIINKYDFDRVQRIIEQKRPVKTVLTETQTILLEKTFCHICGKPLTRMVGNKRIENWLCPNCYYGYKITDEMLKSAVVSILNTLIANPELADLIDIKTYEPTEEIIRREQNISTRIYESKADIEEIKKLIFLNAEKKYDQCLSDEYINATEIIKYELSQNTATKEFSIELFNKIVKRIMPDTEYTIYVQLINGKVLRQEIKKGEKL